MNKFIFSHRDIVRDASGTGSPTTASAVGTQRKQRSQSQVVPDGFLEEEEEGEDGGWEVGH